MDLAIEATDASALVTLVTTDRSGLLARLDLSTLAIKEIIAWGLADPRGVAIEPGGRTALVAESGKRRLIRVDLSRGSITEVATGLDDPREVVIEPGGQTALVTALRRVARVSLATGTIQDITTGLFRPEGIALEPDGRTALVLDERGLLRVNLSTGEVSLIATSQTIGGRPTAILAIEPGGKTALVQADALVRVDLAKGEATAVGGPFSGYALLAIEPAGTTALAGDGSRVMRVYLTSSISTLGPALGAPSDVAIEAGGKTALVVDSPRLLRVDLASRTARTIASLQGQSIVGLAIEPGGNSALVTANGTDLVRIDLANGSAKSITSLLVGARSVAIEQGGRTALVAGRGLQRVDLTSGGVTLVAPGVGPGDLAIEHGGATVLVLHKTGTSLVRVDLASGRTTEIARLGPRVWPVAPEMLERMEGAGSSLAIEEDGRSVLVTQLGKVLRIDLATGAVTVVIPWGLYIGGPPGIAIEAGGATALVADYKNGLVRVGVPQVP